MIIRRRKPGIIIIGTIAGLAIIILSVKLVIDNGYRKQIPRLPDFQSVDKPVQKQIFNADTKAHYKPTAGNLGMLGMVYHSSMYYEKAARCYELAVRKNKKEWLWSYYLGYLNREMGESSAAIENFQSVIKINPKIFLALYYTGEALQSLGKNDQSEAIFASIPGEKNVRSGEENKSTGEDFPLRTYASFQLARIYINTQRLLIAEKTLNKIIQSEQTFGPAYRLLGNLYKMKGDSVLSKEFLLKANDLNDISSPLDKLIDGIALLSRSDQYLLKQIDEAEKKAHPQFALVLTDHALKFMPDNKFLVSRAIKLLLNMNYCKQALPYLERHINYFNNDFKELKEIANLLYTREQYSQSFTYYKRAEELNPQDTEVQSSLVLCLWREGKKDQALEKMNNLVQSDKENLKILSNGVYVMLVIGEKETALLYLSRLNQLSPANPRVQLMRGMVYEMNGKLQEAMVMYRLSFGTNPRDMAVIQALGNSLTTQKLWSAAIAHYRKSLEYFPNEPYLLEKLGSLLIDCPDLKLRNIEVGRKLSERVFIHKASTPDLIIAAGRSIAMAYADGGDFVKAYAYIDYVLNIAKTRKAPVKITGDLENLLMQYRNRK